MASTILVPTDFSVNSKAGIRFAIQLAKQGNAALIFYHCVPLMKPTRWSEATFRGYVEKETAEARKILDRFIRAIYKSAGKRGTRYTCVVQHDSDVQRAILGYAAHIRADAICMSTTGAGRIKKMLGTHASGIIQASEIPVFVIPKNYRSAPITRLLYASDLNAVGAELKQVGRYARLLHADVSVFHYDYLADVKEARNKLEKVARRYEGKGIEFTFEKFNVGTSLGQHLIRDMRKAKASVVVLFTNQKRGWFDKLFLSSRTENLVFDSRVPLLVFPKK